MFDAAWARPAYQLIRLQMSGAGAAKIQDSTWWTDAVSDPVALDHPITPDTRRVHVTTITHLAAHTCVCPALETFVHPLHLPSGSSSHTGPKMPGSSYNGLLNTCSNRDGLRCLGDALAKT